LPASRPPVGLGGGELVAVEARLLDDEQRQALGALGRIGIGAREQRDHVGAPRERAPRLGAGDRVAGDAVDRRRGRAARDRSHVGADVGFGHRDGHHDLARGDARQPRALLRVGAAGEQRLGQDLGAGDERAGAGQRRPRQLLGGEDHRQVAELVAAERLGHRQPEVAELGHRGDEAVRHQLVGAMDVLGVRRDLLVGELAHARAHLGERRVERPRVLAARRRDRLADRAHRVLAAEPRQRGALGGVVHRIGQAQLGGDRVEALARAARQVGDRDPRRRDERGVGAGVRRQRGHERARDPRVRGRRRDLLDDDLVFVDALTAGGERGGGGERQGGQPLERRGDRADIIVGRGRVHRLAAYSV
jgi:hypothetical protein